jgi:short-subunit dehydrogenase
MKIELKALSDQVMLITGASSGIGLVTARAAAARGAKVMLVARDEAALAHAVDDIVSRGGSAAFAVADVGDAGQLAAAAEQAIRRWGRIDTWVNDAGVGIVARLVETPLAEHHRIFRTNYFGVVNGAAVAVPHMREHGGALITVASVAADVPAPMLGAYAATKHAVRAFVETLRMELLADAVPVSVTLIKPSGVDTPFALHSANHAPGAAVIPKPVYAPDLVAEAILDAAEHPHRNVTVGGAGRLQVLLATHFPALLDRMARFLIRQTFDPAEPRRERSALFVPSGRHWAQSGTMSPRRTSLYTAARRHPVAALASAALVAGIASLLLSQHRRRG